MAEAVDLKIYPAEGARAAAVARQLSQQALAAVLPDIDPHRMPEEALNLDPNEQLPD